MRLNLDNASPKDEGLIKSWESYPKNPWVFEIAPSQLVEGGEIKRISIKKKNEPEQTTEFYRFDRDFVKQKLMKFFLLPLMPSVNYADLITLFHEASLELYDRHPNFVDYLPDPAIEVLAFVANIEKGEDDAE